MYVIFIYLYNFTYLHRGYDQAHSKSVLYKMEFTIFVFYNWSHSFIPHFSWMLSQFSNLKEISPNHYFKLSTFWEKVKTRLLETEFQTSKVIQIVFCLQGHIGTQSEDFLSQSEFPPLGLTIIEWRLYIMTRAEPKFRSCQQLVAQMSGHQGQKSPTIWGLVVQWDIYLPILL